jgi:hypothetical protein
VDSHTKSRKSYSHQTTRPRGWRHSHRHYRPALDRWCPRFPTHRLLGRPTRSPVLSKTSPAVEASKTGSSGSTGSLKDREPEATTSSAKSSQSEKTGTSEAQNESPDGGQESAESPGSGQTSVGNTTAGEDEKDKCCVCKKKITNRPTTVSMSSVCNVCNNRLVSAGSVPSV